MNETRGNPGGAAVLSFILTGLGQIYNGQIKKGLMLFFSASIGMLVLIIGAMLLAFWMLGKVDFQGQLIAGGALFAAGAGFTCVLGVYSIMDAFRVASGAAKQ